MSIAAARTRTTIVGAGVASALIAATAVVGPAAAADPTPGVDVAQVRADVREAMRATRQIAKGSATEVAAVQQARQAGPSALAKVAAARQEAIMAQYTPAWSKAWAKQYMAGKYGWGAGEYDALVTLWNHESEWDFRSENPTSGAYGIPQSLPGDKMASAGADWRTNPRTQIKWGLEYIQSTYGSPSAAWGFWTSNNWY